MSTSTTTEQASIAIAVTAYCVALITVVSLIYNELTKRKSLQILTWNGQSTDDKATQNTTASIQQQSPSANRSKEFISGSMHYLSIIIYICGIVACIGGVLRAIPNECQYWSITTHIVGHGVSKMFIYYFQLQRYYLCFVKDFVNTSTTSIKSRMNVFVIIFYVIVLIGIITTAICMLTVIMALFIGTGTKTIYSWKGIWCTITTDDVITRYWLFINVVLFVIYDWIILILFIFTLRTLWIKLKLISNISLSRSNTDAKSQNSYEIDHDRAINDAEQPSNDIETATVKGIEKLKWILTRILICSMAMEIPYLFATVLAGVTQVGTLLWSSSYVMYAIDTVVNVIMIDLMLQHNTTNYKRFINGLSRVSAIFCCRACSCSLDDGMGSQNVSKRRQSKTTAESDVTMNTAMCTSKIAVDRSYFESQPSRDERMIPDPL